MLKILQARLQQYVNRELPDVQSGFRNGRGIRDQIANIRWIIKKARDVPEKHLNGWMRNAEAETASNVNFIAYSPWIV